MKIKDVYRQQSSKDLYNDIMQLVVLDKLGLYLPSASRYWSIFIELSVVTILRIDEYTNADKSSKLVKLYHLNQMVRYHV